MTFPEHKVSSLFYDSHASYFFKTHFSERDIFCFLISHTVIPTLRLIEEDKLKMRDIIL